MTTTTDLGREAIAAVDRQGHLDDILGLPDQLRDALWRVWAGGDACATFRAAGVETLGN